jgi:hypothetical protein
MQPTSDPNIVVKPIQVSGATNDPCSLTETVADAPDQWGNSQTFFITPGSAPLPVPGSQALVAKSPQGVFSVQYPNAGVFTATFNIATLTLSITPGGTLVTTPNNFNTPGTYFVVTDLTSSGQTLTFHDTHDVNLNCLGHTLTTTGTVGALVLQNIDGASVTNCKIRTVSPLNFFAAEVDSVHQGTFQANDLGPVSVTNSSGLKVNGNTIHLTFQQESTSGSVIQNNTFLGDPGSIQAGLVVTDFGNTNTIINNTMDGKWNGVPNAQVGADDGIVIQSEFNDLVLSNTIQNTFDCGFEGVGTLNTSVVDNNTISTANFCCVGAFLATNWQGNEVAGNSCTNIGEMFAFRRSAGPIQGEPTVFFRDNAFRNNTQQPGGTIFQSVIDFLHVPAGLTLSLGNNRLTGNTFLGTTPLLLPASMFVDGGGNVCAKGGDPTFPLSCGRP